MSRISKLAMALMLFSGAVGSCIASAAGASAAAGVAATAATAASVSHVATHAPEQILKDQVSANTKGKKALGYHISQLPHAIDLKAADKTYFLATRTRIAEPRFFVRDQDQNEQAASALDEALFQLSREYDANLGLVVLNEDGLFMLRDNRVFPIMSVMKFNLAYAVAHKMQNSGHDLGHTIAVKSSELDPKTYSPMYEEMKHLGMVEGKNSPETVNLSLGDLIHYSVSQSDNNACDILLTRYLSGPNELEQFMKAQGLNLVSIKYTESEMGADVMKSYENFISPYDMAKSIALYAQDTTLSDELKSYLDECMLFAATGANRIQKGIKDSIAKVDDQGESFRTLRIFDKTGSGGTNKDGRRIAVNDAAFVSYEGKPYVIVVFVKDIAGDASKTMAKGEELIQKTTTLVFDYLRGAFHQGD